jgi:hypothetical protein
MSIHTYPMTMLIRHVVAVTVAAATTALPAQGPPRGSAAWVVHMFFDTKSFPDEQAYVAPEFASYASQPTIGSTIRPGVSVRSRLVSGTDRVTFYATTVRDSAHLEEWYTQLRNEGGVWKIVTIRTVRMPSAFYAAIDSLSHAPPPPLNAPHLLERMQLLVASDSVRAAHVRGHRAAFDSLANAMAGQSTVRAVNDAGDSPGGDPSAIVSRVATSLRQLRLGAALRSPEGCVIAKIGGVHDAARETSVGYVYAPPGCQPPAMGQPGYIYVEAIAPRWYSFKYQVAGG